MQLGKSKTYKFKRFFGAGPKPVGIEIEPALTMGERFKAMRVSRGVPAFVTSLPLC